VAEQKPPVFIIGKRTPITIGLLISIVGGVAWLTELKYQNDANAKEILEVKVDQKDMNKSLIKIEKWLAAIGQKLRIEEPKGE
jgi:hypothetical protein